ncbi:MAG TPA: MarR family transcriptional regulator [Ktedonosporobacter sp.]|jgi:DNA-binding MarR family transcriptional regulator|nr:MarR family transcriptional regulator [Ktedonosporobacter sp.]
MPQEQESEQGRTVLAEALLDIVPRLLRRVGADVPLDKGSAETGETDPRWHAVSELRATPGQLTLLHILIEHQRCTMQELAEHLGVAPSTATAMVKRLLAQGYVERSRDDVDWRTVWVGTTERGRQAVTAFDSARQASLSHRLAKLSEEERESIMAALPALRHLVEVF